MALPYVLGTPARLLGREGAKGTSMKHRTNQEHVQAVREGKDYHSPKLAINETIDHLVDCALIVKNHEVALTAETRALDAVGVQVARELKNRAEMIHALTDRLTAVEGTRDMLQEELAAIREPYEKLQVEVEELKHDLKRQMDITNEYVNERARGMKSPTSPLKDYPEVQEQLAGAQFSG